MKLFCLYDINSIIDYLAYETERGKEFYIFWFLLCTIHKIFKIFSYLLFDFVSGV